MSKVHRNGNVIIRVSDIVAAHIPSDETDVVEICTRYALANFRFKCKTEQEANGYIDQLQKMMEDEEGIQKAEG